MGSLGTGVPWPRPRGTECAILTDPCFGCIGVTCGASYGPCMGDPGCNAAIGVATDCICGAQIGEDTRAVDTCLADFSSGGGPQAGAFGDCLANSCGACGF